MAQTDRTTSGFVNMMLDPDERLSDSPLLDLADWGPRRWAAVLIFGPRSAWEIGEGRDPEVGLGAVLRRSSNWFLPDDHEFWNGYPELSYFTMTLHALRRAVVQLFRYSSRKGEPHPASQGRFGAAAGNGFMVFQSPLDRSESDGSWTFDDTMSPSQVQRIELDRLLILIVDTRWHRTIRRNLPGSGFMLPADLDEVAEALGDERPVVLMTGRPMVGYPPRRSRFGVDVGAESYIEQYQRLCRAVSERAERGGATVMVGGDVHRHGLSSALDDKIVQIVSSPLALLDGGEGGSLLGRMALRLRSAIGSMFRSQLIPAGFPRFDGEAMQVESGTVLFEAGPTANGLACLSLDHSDSKHPAFKRSFAGFDGDRELAETWEFRWTGDRWRRA